MSLVIYSIDCSVVKCYVCVANVVQHIESCVVDVVAFDIYVVSFCYISIAIFCNRTIYIICHVDFTIVFHCEIQCCIIIYINSVVIFNTFRFSIVIFKCVCSVVCNNIQISIAPDSTTLCCT